MLDNACQTITVPRSVLHNGIIKDRLIAGRLRIVRTSILICPGLQDIDDRKLGIPITIDRCRRIDRPMELQERISRIPLSGGAGSHALNVVGVIPGAADSRESRKPASNRGIAGDDAGEGTAVRFAGREYFACVDAEGFFQVREQIVGEV